MNSEDKPTIYIIQRVDHYRDIDNYPAAHVHLQDQYGYFTSKEDAEAFRVKLEADDRQKFLHRVAEEHKAYRKKLAAYEQRREEIATLKAAGMKPTMGLLPKPYKPWLKESDWSKQEEYTSYELYDIEASTKEVRR